MYRNTVAAEEYIRLRKSHKKLLNSLDVKSDLLSSLYQEVNKKAFQSKANHPFANRSHVALGTEQSGAEQDGAISPNTIEPQSLGEMDTHDRKH